MFAPPRALSVSLPPNPAIRTAALLTLALAGCHRKAPPSLAVAKLTVSEESLAAAPALGLGAEQMKAAVKTALERQGAVVLQDGQSAPPGSQVYRVRAEIGGAQLQDVALPDGGVGQEAQVEAVLEGARASSEGTLKLSGTGEGHVAAPAAPDTEGQAAAFKSSFAKAVDLAAARLARSAVAVEAPVETLHADLGSPDSGVQEAAADVLVDHHDLAAIPVLVQELDSPDDSVKMKAIGELVELKAKTSVPKLIDLAQTSDPRLGTDPHFQMQIIYALGTIGGDEAEAYLYTIASGHPDEMVRNAAKEASAELHRSHARVSHKELPQ
ncbi:MAG: HEAT repeat domain-containing protein [Deltaproteobacteria bacterium]|nr:HEAT repeat domain-containing protein [Deltaproteobacteria bacterium]